MRTEPGLWVPDEAVEWAWADAEPFRSLVAHSTDVITIGQPGGLIRWVSPSIERALGYRPEELVGGNGADIVHPDDVGGVAAGIASIPRGASTAPINLRCRHRDGSWRHFEVVSTNLVDEPGVRGIVSNARDVTDRLDAELALRRSEESFRMFASSAPVGIMFADDEAHITYVNDRWVEITGIPRDEAHGQAWARLHPPDDDGAVLAGIAEALEREGRADFACRAVRPDGTAVWVRGQTIRVRGTDGATAGYVSSLEDVTAERLAHMREEQWAALVEHSHDLTSIYDAEGKIAYASPSHERVLGYTSEELTGISPLDFLHPDERDEVLRAFIEQFRANEPAPVQHRFLHKNGSWRYLESVAADLRSDPAIGGFLINARDVTDRRKAELVSKDQARILDGVARGVSLRSTLDAVVEMMERWSPGGRGVITRVEPAEGMLQVAAAPNLDSQCVGALEGIRVAPRVRDDYPERFYVMSLGSDGRYESSSSVLAERGFRSTWACPMDDPSGDRRIGGVMQLRRDDESPTAWDRSVMEVAAALAGVAIERDRAASQLAHQARHDALTGLPNREQVVQRLRHLANDGADGSQTAVLFLDLDRFKVLNDSVGHDAGDRLLVEMGARLRQAVRPDDLVARFGGDEFVMVCEQVDGERAARELADRVLEVVRHPFAVDGSEVVVTASIGISMVDGRAPEALLRDADAAMYHAKDRGRARVELFDDQLRRRVVGRLDIERELRRALDGDGLVLHYQPVVTIDDGAVAAFEALVRWEHPQRGLLHPARFLGVAEECGLIRQLGSWVREAACRQSVRWREEHPEWGKLVIGINLSAGELMDPHLGHNIARTIDETGVDPTDVSIEITERLLFEDERAARALFARLGELGVMLALDDFGTGYSPLVHLKNFPVHAIKIDRSFVSGLGIDPFDDAIVEGVIDLASRLDLFSIAEGVETQEQLDRLARTSCMLAQGYYYSRAMPPEAVTEWMSDRRPLRADG